MIRGAPIGTFGYFDRVYTIMGGRTPEAGDPAIATLDGSRGVLFSRIPRDIGSVDSQGEAVFYLGVWERLSGGREKRWSAQITNADQVLSLGEDGVERKKQDLDGVLNKARSIIEEVQANGGITSSPLPLF